MIAPNEQIAGREKNLSGIETLCRDFDAESAKLEEMIGSLEADLDEVKNRHLAALKRQAGVVARREAELTSAIEAAPSLFVKPRTATMHGVKVGLSSSVGKLAFDDEDTVVGLIKRHFGVDSDLYIHTTEKPNKDALKTLSIGQLAKLGCRIDGAGDVVVCKRVAGDVEKLINKLIEKLVEAMVGED
jgi:hypothetical protein